MSGASLIYWLAVGVAALAAVVVLVGIGYLLGRSAERREALARLRLIEGSVDRLKSAMGRPITLRVMR